METTNVELSKKAKISKFMDTAFEIAEEIGENEMTVKTYDGCISAEIQTKQEINLHKVSQLAGDISATIFTCDYGLELILREKF